MVRIEESSYVAKNHAISKSFEITTKKNGKQFSLRKARHCSLQFEIQVRCFLEPMAATLIANSILCTFCTFWN